MFTGFVRYANTKTGNEIIDKSIAGFRYDNLDLICVYENDSNIEIDTIPIVKQILGVEEKEIALEELKDMFVDYMNGEYVIQEDVVDESVDENVEDIEENVDETTSEE